MFDLQKVGQGHRVQFSQKHHSIANVKIYKKFPHIFALALSTSEILNLLNFDLQKVDQGHCV